MFTKLEKIFKTIKEVEYHRIKINNQLVQRPHYDTYTLVLPDKDKSICIHNNEKDNSYTFYWNTLEGNKIFSITIGKDSVTLEPRLFPLDINKQIIVDCIDYVEKTLTVVKEQLDDKVALEQKQIKHRQELEQEFCPNNKITSFIKQLF